MDAVSCSSRGGNGSAVTGSAAVSGTGLPLGDICQADQVPGKPALFHSARPASGSGMRGGLRHQLEYSNPMSTSMTL